MRPGCMQQLAPQAPPDCLTTCWPGQPLRCRVRRAKDISHNGCKPSRKRPRSRRHPRLPRPRTKSAIRLIGPSPNRHGGPADGGQPTTKCSPALPPKLSRRPARCPPTGPPPRSDHPRRVPRNASVACPPLGGPEHLLCRRTDTAGPGTIARRRTPGSPDSAARPFLPLRPKNPHHDERVPAGDSLMQSRATCTMGNAAQRPAATPGATWMPEAATEGESAPAPDCALDAGKRARGQRAPGPFRQCPGPDAPQLLFLGSAKSHGPEIPLWRPSELR